MRFFARMSALMSWLQFMGPSSPRSFQCNFKAYLLYAVLMQNYDKRSAYRGVANLCIHMLGSSLVFKTSPIQNQGFIRLLLQAAQHLFRKPSSHLSSTARRAAIRVSAVSPLAPSVPSTRLSAFSLLASSGADLGGGGIGLDSRAL